jgi:hypothetical protein
VTGGSSPSVRRLNLGKLDLSRPSPKAWISNTVFAIRRPKTFLQYCRRRGSNPDGHEQITDKYYFWI